MTQPIGIRLDPLDVLFFRGGRPFDASSRVEGELPNPQTLTGALRTALLARHAPADLFRNLRGSGDIVKRLEKAGAPAWILQARFRGPWLALAEKGDADLEPLVPVPGILYRDEGRNTVHRSVPREGGKLPGWTHPEGRWPLWRTDGAAAKLATGYLTRDGLANFLKGNTPSPEQILKPEVLFDYDNRTGIGISPDSFTTEESQIYGIKFLALKPWIDNEDSPFYKRRVCFYAEILPGEGAPTGDLLRDPLPFGGEGRYVAVKQVPTFAWPQGPVTGERCLWLMISPGIFAAERPDVPDVNGLGTLRAAASGSPMAVSGWNIHNNGPNPTRFAVPAGAVYFVQGSISLPDNSLCADVERIAQGWGFALRGVW